MGESYTFGRVVWRDLTTTEPEKARAFYGELFGWTFQTWHGGGDYAVVQKGEKSIGGILRSPGGPAKFVSYVSVPDVDAAAKAAAENGGRIYRPPETMPNVGRFAVFADFAGAAISALRNEHGDGVGGRAAPGEYCWETLGTTDVDRAKEFYGEVFGWRPTTGPTGEGVVFATADGVEVADVVISQRRPPSWTTYVAVETIEPAVERARKLGAEVPLPLLEIAKVGRVAMIVDPQGAALGLLQRP
jgi:predicted enzyme related to lactoylglutathione lyase